MITEELVEHFNGPMSTSIGTCNLDGIPNFARVWGVQIDDERKKMTIFLPEVVGKVAIVNLKENPKIAYNIADMANFQTRQYKGTVIEIRTATHEEFEIADEMCKNGLVPVGEFFGVDQANAWKNYIKTPLFAITFEVEEIYNQTPGKFAGTRLI